MHTMQRDRIGATHRQQVFEWNLELADRDLQLSNQALLLAFNYFDAYLSMIVVPKKGLQLVSTACMWVASKICASECPVAKAEELESLIGIEKRQIVEMERWIVRFVSWYSVRGRVANTLNLPQLSSLSWDVQPVTSYDIVHLLLPFLFCTREHRQKLIQYIENIALAQALGKPTPNDACYDCADNMEPVPVYPLLRYEPAILAVTAIVCGAKLVTGKIDQQLNRGLIGLIGATPDRVLQCRRDVEAYINLQNLVFTNDGACAAGVLCASVMSPAYMPDSTRDVQIGRMSAANDSSKGSAPTSRLPSVPRWRWQRKSVSIAMISIVLGTIKLQSAQ
jgi:hypothetical protein